MPRYGIDMVLLSSLRFAILFVSRFPAHPTCGIYLYLYLNFRIGAHELLRFLLYFHFVHRWESHVKSKRMISAAISQYGSEVRPALSLWESRRARTLSFSPLRGERYAYWDAIIASSTTAKREYGDPRWIVNRRVTCRSVIPWRFQMRFGLRAQFHFMELFTALSHIGVAQLYGCVIFSRAHGCESHSRRSRGLVFYKSSYVIVESSANRIWFSRPYNCPNVRRSKWKRVRVLDEITALINNSYRKRRER